MGRQTVVGSRWALLWGTAVVLLSATAGNLPLASRLDNPLKHVWETLDQDVILETLWEFGARIRSGAIPIGRRLGRACQAPIGQSADAGVADAPAKRYQRPWAGLGKA